MKAFILSLLLLASFAAFGENAATMQIDEQASRYADTLVNIVFTVNHADVFEAWLDSFRKDKDYSQEAMAKALVSIVERSVASGNEDDLHTASTAISAMSCLQLTNMLPVLREWVLRGGDLCPSSFCAYGEICGNDKRYLDLGLECVNRKVFSMDYLTSQLCSTLSVDKQGRLAVPLDEPTRVRMQKTIFDSAFEIPPGRGGRDAYFCQLIPGYSNSQERVMILKRILDNVDTIPRPREGVRQLYLFPYDNKGYEYDDLTNKVRSFCEGELKRIERLPMANSASVAEIIRTKSIPENERLNMTAILDAKIAAIEAAEARAARRAAWKRRLRLGTFLILPVLCVAFAVHLVLKKKTAYGKSSWWRTVESLVVVIVMVALVGVVSFFEHRRDVQETAEETNPSATLGLETTCVVWQKGSYDKYRREKELADAAVLKFRVTNQLDSMIGQYESLKCARNQLLIDLAQAESRMSNETVAAEMDFLGKQAAALREKVAENVRACEELYVCISNQEHTLMQLESTRKMANQNFSNFIHRLEGASLPAADPPAENAIEAAQARAARREVWKRRLRLGALVLSIPVIAFVAILARRRRSK